MTPAYPLLAAFAAAVALGLTYRLARAGRDRKAARASYFSALKPLFDSGETKLQLTGFPRMTGRRGEMAFDLQALPDTLTFRKLPALWVLVSLPETLPLAATLGLMARPSGQEPFSKFAELSQSLPRPAFLPEAIAVRTDDATGIPPESLLARHAGLFADPMIKELVISPKGLRIVVLAEEADQGRFLIFRDAEMGMTPLPPAKVAPLLDRIAALRDDLLAWSKERA